MNAVPNPAGSRPDVDADVLIVGYGPVGQLLAVLLAQYGWNVVVVEQWPRPYPMPRAVAFDGHAARVLAAAGVAEQIGHIGEPSQDYVIVNRDGQELLRIELRPDGRQGWPDSTSMYQPGLEAALAERGRQLPNLRVLRGRRAIKLVDHGPFLELCTTDTESGAEHTLTAQWVVGCDGANSFVRASRGITLSDLNFSLDWMACDVVPHDPGQFVAGNLQIADPARPRVAVSAGPGHLRWEFMRMPGETREEFDTVENAWRLLATFDVNPHNATLDRYAVYTFGARNADSWRSGRVLLAGDSAHQMPPFAGQGMCSGIRDAMNLAWKLDLVLRGVAGESLLDSYQVERRPHVQQVIELSVQLGQIICVTNPVGAALRDRAMLGGRTRPARPLTLDDALHGGVVHHGRAAGQLSPQATVARNRAVGLFDTLVGTGFVLLSSEDPARLVGAGEVDLVRTLGVRLVHVLPAGSPQDGEAVVDVDEVYLRWLADIDAVAVLVRPDFYVFGAARDSGELAAVLHDLRDQLSA